MRITGGTFRSRVLRAPKGTATRPTSDRVREALFSILASSGYLGDAARVLDLYAGSGALAFEALSRGAREAVLVEHASPALAAIRENAQALGVVSQVRVVATRVERAILTLDGSFDIVFADPPYADVPVPAFAELLGSASRVLAPDGALVLEHASGDAPPTMADLVFDRTRIYGDTAVTLYRRA